MSGRTVLVTGCSNGGLGAALALAFHKKGYRVIATARNVAKMSDMKKEGIITLALDVQSKKSIKQCIDEVSKITGGSLDMLVNNAGAGLSMPILDVDMDAMRNLFDLNVFSVISMIQSFAPLLRKSNDAVIVNNTSVAGSVTGGVPIQGTYNASKAAMAMFTQNLRLELAPFGIKVVDLKTGAVRTNFFANVGEAKLPENSWYQSGKEGILKFMEGVGLMDGAMSSDVWAQQVVSDLSTKNPPYQIWRGSSALMLKTMQIFPTWLFDGPVKQLTGLSAFEKQLKLESSSKRR